MMCPWPCCSWNHFHSLSILTCSILVGTDGSIIQTPSRTNAVMPNSSGRNIKCQPMDSQVKVIRQLYSLWPTAAALSTWRLWTKFAAGETTVVSCIDTVYPVPPFLIPPSLYPLTSPAPVPGGWGLRRIQRRRLRRRGQHPLQRWQDRRVDGGLREPGSCDTHRVSLAAWLLLVFFSLHHSFFFFFLIIWSPTGEFTRSAWASPWRWPSATSPTPTRPPKAAPQLRTSLLFENVPYVPLSFPCLTCCCRWGKTEKHTHTRTQKQPYCLLCCKRLLRNATWKRKQPQEREHVPPTNQHRNHRKQWGDLERTDARECIFFNTNSKRYY